MNVKNQKSLILTFTTLAVLLSLSQCAIKLTSQEVKILENVLDQDDQNYLTGNLQVTYNPEDQQSQMVIPHFTTSKFILPVQNQEGLAEVKLCPYGIEYFTEDDMCSINAEEKSTFKFNGSEYGYVEGKTVLVTDVSTFDGSITERVSVHIPTADDGKELFAEYDKNGVFGLGPTSPVYKFYRDAYSPPSGGAHESATFRLVVGADGQSIKPQYITQEKIENAKAFSGSFLSLELGQKNHISKNVQKGYMKIEMDPAEKLETWVLPDSFLLVGKEKVMRGKACFNSDSLKIFNLKPEDYKKFSQLICSKDECQGLESGDWVKNAPEIQMNFKFITHEEENTEELDNDETTGTESQKEETKEEPEDPQGRRILQKKVEVEDSKSITTTGTDTKQNFEIKTVSLKSEEYLAVNSEGKVVVAISAMDKAFYENCGQESSLGIGNLFFAKFYVGFRVSETAQTIIIAGSLGKGVADPDDPHFNKQSDLPLSTKDMVLGGLVFIMVVLIFIMACVFMVSSLRRSKSGLHRDSDEVESQLDVYNSASKYSAL